MKKNLLLFSFLASTLAQGEGFLAGTLIKTKTGYTPIEELKVGDKVICFDFDKTCVEKPVSHIHQKQTSQFLSVIVNGTEIIVTDDHKFYIPLKKGWFEARKLQKGQALLKNCLELANVDEVTELFGNAIAYDLSVEDFHNFCITQEDIIVHNALPLIALGITWTFGEGIAITGGIGLGALFFGTALYQGCKNNQKEREFRKSNTSEKDDYVHYSVPGKPNGDDGFIPPKRWEGEKVRHPETGQYGWPDKEGNVWVPSGANGHGGPHWDVVDEDGNHINVIPGGGIRGQKK